MVLKRKINYFNDISVAKLGKNEVPGRPLLQNIIWLFSQKLKNQDGRQKPSWF